MFIFYQFAGRSPWLRDCKISIIIKNITSFGRMQILGVQGFRCPAFALQATAGRQVSGVRGQMANSREQKTPLRPKGFGGQAADRKQMTENRRR